MKERSCVGILTKARQHYGAKEFSTSSCGAIILFSGIIISSIFILQCNTDDAFASPSLTLTLDSSSINLSLIPKSGNGTFAKSGNLSVNVALNGPGGYTLSIRSGGSGANATNLVNTSDNTKYFTSISSALSESDFSNSNNTTYNNQWGYLPSKLNSATNTSFLPAPSTTGDLLDYTEDDDAENTYTISIGARADLSTPVGSYNNTFIITAIANLSCNSSATTIGEAVCMQDFNNDNTITVNGNTTTYRNAIINSMEMNRQYQLRDGRDWKTYYIAKMKDGRVWMTQNLDLDLETIPNNVSKLTSENTDLNAFGLQGYTTENGYSCSNTNTSTNCTSGDEVIAWSPSVATATTMTGYGENSNTTPASFDYGDVYSYVDTNGSTISYTSTLDCIIAHNDGSCPHYHVGNYYNWTSAIASNNSNTITVTHTTAHNSICPVGWRLPIGKASTTSSDPGYYDEINYTWVNEGLTKDYAPNTSILAYIPDNTTGFLNIRRGSMYMVASGYKHGTNLSINDIGTRGYYWTNTVTSNTTAFSPHFYDSGLYVVNTYNRGRGISIRCVARQENTGTTTITFNNNESSTTGTATGTTGTNNTVTYNANTLNTLPSNGFAISGYQFNSWNTEADGSGTSYADAGQYYASVGVATRNVTLYAQWDKKYTITFSTGSHVARISFDGTYYTNGQTTQATVGKTYVIGGDYDTKYGFNSWSVTSGTLENSNAPATNYTVTETRP